MIDIEASLEASRRQHAEGCVKTWEDLDRYRRLIAQVRPACVVELGTFSGKSAVWFHREAGCPVVTVDVGNCADPATIREGGDSVVWMVGSSTAPAMVEAVCALARELADGGRILLVLDSDHSGRHVLDEMTAYAGLVDPGSYMVVEDGILRWMSDHERSFYDGTPLDAIEAWMSGDRDERWTIDQALEDLHATTQFPSGWIRRVR